MKNSLIIFCSVALIVTLAVFAFNTDKGPVQQSDGINELQLPAADTLVLRGRALIAPMHYTDQDLKAIAAYLNTR
jgi:hypothetical protein